MPPDHLRIQLEGDPAALAALRRHIENTPGLTITQAVIYAPQSANGATPPPHQMILHAQMQAGADVAAAPEPAPVEARAVWQPSTAARAAREQQEAARRRQQAARQFAEVEKQLRTLHRMSQEGLIQRREFMRRLRERIITDEQGNQWMMTNDADGWLKFTGEGGWVRATPDALRGD